MRHTAEIIIELENRIKFLQENINKFIVSDKDRSEIPNLFTAEEMSQMSYIAEMQNLLTWISEEKKIVPQKYIVLSINSNSVKDLPNCDITLENEEQKDFIINKYDSSDKEHPLGECYWNKNEKLNCVIILTHGLDKIKDMIVSMYAGR